MPQSYALQVLILALGMSGLGLGSVLIAARIYDRNTRRLEAAARARKDA